MARIRGSRGRLVGYAVVFLFTLNSCWNAEARESTTGGEAASDGALVDQRREVVMVVVVVIDRRVYPSTNWRGVTGLKGSPLRKKLAKRRRRRVEHKPTAMATVATKEKPMLLRVVVLVLRPAGTAVEAERRSCEQHRLVVALRLLLKHDRVLKGLQRQTKILLPQIRCRRRVTLKWRRGSFDGKESLDCLSNVISVQRRWQKTRTTVVLAVAHVSIFTLQLLVRKLFLNSGSAGDNVALATAAKGYWVFYRERLVVAEDDFLLLRRLHWRGRRVPRWELCELVDGRLSFFYEPVHRLAGAVIAEAVLDVVELDGGVRRQAHTAVSGAFCSADLAVAVLPPGGADNVAALHLHDLADAAASHRRSRRCCCLVKEKVVLWFSHLSRMFGWSKRGRRWWKRREERAFLW